MHKIYKLPFDGGVRYFLPYASDGIKYRGILFARTGFYSDEPFIAFETEFSKETVGKVESVCEISDGEIVDFLFNALSFKHG